MSEGLTPGDISLIVSDFERVKAEYRRRQRDFSDESPVQNLANSVAAVPVAGASGLLKYNPEQSRRRRYWHTARKFKKLQAELRQLADQSGVEKLDEARLEQLDDYRCIFEYGRRIDRCSRKLLQHAIDTGKHSKESLHHAVYSLGGLTTRDGQLYANPVRPSTGYFIFSLIAITTLVAVLCVIALGVELVMATCQPCVLLGAITMLLLAAYTWHTLYQMGPVRNRYAKILMEVGIAPVSSRPDRGGPFGVIQFLQWR